MNKKDVIDFFNEQALCWDEQMIRYDDVIRQILDNAMVTEGKRILDVACGTGVLIPDYLERKVEFVTAIDISSEMIKIAKGKFAQENVEIICGDIETVEFPNVFDNIVVYNAFPHFPNPQVLIENLSKALKSGGKISVAHGMSKKELDEVHQKSAGRVSSLLPECDELAEMLEPYFNVDIKLSDDNMYQVTGTKK